MSFLRFTLLLLFVTLASLVYANDHDQFTLQCPGDWALYKSQTETEEDPSKCIKLFGTVADGVSYSVAQNYCSKTLPLLQKDTPEQPQMLRLTTAAQEDFLRQYFTLLDADVLGQLTVHQAWFGLQYFIGDKQWHWATKADDTPTGPLVREKYTLEQATKTRFYEDPPEHTYCAYLNNYELGWDVDRCDGPVRGVVCESKPKKVAVAKPINGEDLRKIEEKIDSLKIELTTRIEEMGTHLENIKLPIGFIYVQLPMEKSPTELWASIPHYQWTDVSDSYDSLFFRVTGKQAEPFGNVQEQQTGPIKFVDGVQRDSCQLSSDRKDCIKEKKTENSRQSSSHNCIAPVSVFVNLTSNVGVNSDSSCSNDGWSDPVWTAFNYASISSEAYDDVKAYADYHRYHVTTEHEGGEVRPRNMAIKVWKRTA